MKEYNLEWYVLNGSFIKKDNEYAHYPYCFYNTGVKPFNVFDNGSFYLRTIKLAKAYRKGEIKNYAEKNYFSVEDIDTKTDFNLFKELLLRELAYEEQGRCEYECCVADWPPVYRNKDGKQISVYAGRDHEEIDDVDMDKIDCYTQVLPNADIFARYVLLTVNKSLDVRKPKKKAK